jgi:hypothetical protein
MNAGFYKDALFSGMTNSSFKFGTILTLGWFWVRVAGCSALYRGPKISEVDFDYALSVEPFDAVQINVPDYAQHLANTTYFYVLRKVNGCGDQEKTFSAAAVVEIDADGDLAKAEPNKVFGINVNLVSGPRAKLIWCYCTLNQQSKPAYFEVYGDNATGQIDYEDPLATIDYLGRRYYCWLSDVLSAGRYSFAVRVFDSSGINENSSAVINIGVTNSSPDLVDILSVETI